MLEKLTRQDTFGNLGKRVWGILLPEEIVAFQVVSLPRGFTLRCSFDSYAIELDGQNIRDERLVLWSALPLWPVCTVQECEIMGIRSRLRSRMIITTVTWSEIPMGSTRSLLIWGRIRIDWGTARVCEVIA